MGTGRNVKCNSCGKEWLHFEGEGFIAAYFYCDKCGKKKVIKRAHDFTLSLPNDINKCKCGGTFKMGNDTIICPKCHINDIVKDGDEIVLWD